MIQGPRKVLRKDGWREKKAVEKKATMLTWKLKQYAVYVAGISETKWFVITFMRWSSRTSIPFCTLAEPSPVMKSK